MPPSSTVQRFEFEPISSASTVESSEMKPIERTIETLTPKQQKKSKPPIRILEDFYSEFSKEESSKEDNRSDFDVAQSVSQESLMSKLKSFLSSSVLKDSDLQYLQEKAKDQTSDEKVHF